MCDEWMPTLRLPMTWEQFRRLPRNSAYKYEYIEGEAWLSPRPRHYHAVRDLRPIEVEDGNEEVELTPIGAEDLDDLVCMFVAAFRDVQPFGSLDEQSRREAARRVLERTRAGGDGPWLEQASFAAWHEGRKVGAVWVTLLPEGDLCDFETYHWQEPPPPDCVERRRGQPHLTWIFVDPFLAGEGVGTTLLAAAVRELLVLGYTRLATTFLCGNVSSMLWHWRHGFRLLPHPSSHRLRKLRWERLRQGQEP